MSAIRTSLPIPVQPWEQAKKKFCEGLSPQEAKYYETATPENLFYDASCAQRQQSRGSRVWRLQARLSPLIDSIEEYGKAMDVFVNTCPLIMSPLWGSLRVILLVAAEAASFQEKLVDCLAQIGDVLPRFRVYEVLFKDHARLLVAMSSAYLDILQFCIATKGFFSQSRKSIIPFSIALRGLWSSHLRTFDEYMSSLHKQTKRIKREAGLAHMIESARNRELQLRNQALQIRNAKLERRNRALLCLPTVDYLNKHSRLSWIRHPGTCVWLQNMFQFNSWFASPDSACLCCYGIPGSGKSILAASLMTVLQGRLTATNDGIICYYYFDYSDHASLDTTRIVASLVKQALENLPLDHFDEDFSYPYGSGHSPPTLTESANYLVSTLQHFCSAYVILDGIDELRADDQANVLKLVEILLQCPGILVKPFVTSRTEEFRVKKALQGHGTLHMFQDKVDADIAKFIEEEVEMIEAPHPLTVEPALKFEVIQALVQGAKGMFLWAKFQMIDIKEGLTKEGIRDTLANLPKGLNETYLRIIHKMQHGPGGASKIVLMRKAFRWIAASRRPLRLKELEEAVALESTDTHLHTERIPRDMGTRLLGAFGNLAIYNEEENTVHFAHHTVKQFFFSLDGIEDRLLSSLSLTASEEQVGDLCLAYLSFSDFETQLAQTPSQAQIGPALAEEILWTSVPLAGRIRNALSLTRPLRGGTKNDVVASIDFSIPVSTAPSVLLMRQYVLLEYIIEFWVYHTSDLRRQRASTTSWSRFEHVALHHQLAFEFRPWNDQTHRSRTRKGLQVFERSDSRMTESHLVGVLNSPGALMQFTIYVWALKHAVGSLFGLLDRSVMDAYLNLARVQTVPAGSESGWITSEHVFAMFNKFPLLTTVRAATNGLLAHERSERTGDLVVRLLDMSMHRHGPFETELLYTFLGYELCRWISPKNWEDLQISAAISALRGGNHASFHFVFQECAGDSTRLASATGAYWQTHASAKIVKACLTRPATGTFGTSNVEWDIVFMLERYYSLGNFPLRISEFMSASETDLNVAQALVVVSLVHKQALSYVIMILDNLEIDATKASVFSPSGDWKASSFGSVDAYQKIAPFLWVDVLSLVRELFSKTDLHKLTLTPVLQDITQVHELDTISRYSTRPPVVDGPHPVPAPCMLRRDPQMDELNAELPKIVDTSEPDNAKDVTLIRLALGLL